MSDLPEATCINLCEEKSGFELRSVLFQVQCFFLHCHPRSGAQDQSRGPVNYATVSYDRGGQLLMSFLQHIRRDPGGGGGDSVGSAMLQGTRQLLKLKVAGLFWGC